MSRLDYLELSVNCCSLRFSRALNDRDHDVQPRFCISSLLEQAIDLPARVRVPWPRRCCRRSSDRLGPGQVLRPGLPDDLPRREHDWLSYHSGLHSRLRLHLYICGADVHSVGRARCCSKCDTELHSGLPI